MGIDPMTHRPRTDIFSSLPHLIALASLKDLIMDQPWEDLHALRSSLQGDQQALQMAKLQYLQYLLQPSNPSSNSLIQNNANYMDQNSFNSTTSNNNSLQFDSIPFAHLPDLLQILPNFGDDISSLGLPSKLEGVSETPENNPNDHRLLGQQDFASMFINNDDDGREIDQMNIFPNFSTWDDNNNHRNVSSEGSTVPSPPSEAGPGPAGNQHHQEVVDVPSVWPHDLILDDTMF